MQFEKGLYSRGSTPFCRAWAIWKSGKCTLGDCSLGYLKVKVGLGRVLRAPSWGLEGPKADTEVQEAAGKGQHGPVGPGVVSGAHSGPNLGSIWAQLGLKNCVKENFGNFLGADLGRFWDGGSGHVGTNKGPKWMQT